MAEADCYPLAMRRRPTLPAWIGLLLAGLLPLVGAGCKGKDSVRGDLVLIVADRAPTGASTLFDELLRDAVTYEGPLDIPTDSRDGEQDLLLELLSGQRAGQPEGSTYEWLLSLPQSAKLSGYRSLCVSDHLDAIEQFGMDEHFDYGLYPATGTEQVERGHGAGAALAALIEDYEARGIDRAPTMLLADLVGTTGQLEPTLAAISGELYAQADLPGAPAQKRHTLCILFTDPASTVRAVISGPGIAPAKIQSAVAPRDFFPTLATRSQIKVTAYLAGVVVPGFLSGTDLLNRE